MRVRLIKAGTLEKLVESLASDTGELESTYVNIFLATYRTFSTANQILALIAKRYADLNHPTVLEAVRLQNKKYSQIVNHLSSRPHFYFIFFNWNVGLFEVPFTFGWMLFRRISVTRLIIPCSTNFCHFVSNMPRTVNFILKSSIVWNA